MRSALTRPRSRVHRRCTRLGHQPRGCSTLHDHQALLATRAEFRGVTCVTTRPSRHRSCWATPGRSQRRRPGAHQTRWPSWLEGARSLMAHPSARDLARQILTRDLARVEAPTAVSAAAAAEVVIHRISDNLVRWVGPDGSQALFARALSLAQAQDPSLTVVPPPAR